MFAAAAVLTALLCAAALGPGSVLASDPIATTAPPPTSGPGGAAPPTSNMFVTPPASSSGAGSASDPLISKSYIDGVLAPQLESAIIAKLAEIQNGGEQNKTPVSYVVVELRAGQTLLAAGGSLEVIVRPGSAATIVAPSATQGAADITTGDELFHGNTAPINHQLLIPRADGRGIRITSDVAYVMVRGEYTIN